MYTYTGACVQCKVVQCKLMSICIVHSHTNFVNLARFACKQWDMYDYHFYSPVQSLKGQYTRAEMGWYATALGFASA